MYVQLGVWLFLLRSQIKESLIASIWRYLTLGSLWHDYFLRVKSKMLWKFYKKGKSVGSQADYTKVWN